VKTGFTANAAGELVCPEPSGENPQSNVRPCLAGKALKDQNVPQAHNFAKGEPFRLGVISSDGSVRAFARVVPDPIEASDGPCRLSVELASPDGLMFVLHGDGFEPDVELTTVTVSGKEKLNNTFRNSTDGKFAIPILPGVVGKKSGSTTVTVSSKSCTVPVRFDWGRAALK
jgi:hypothetical protein